jgi:hypothetical protein
MRSKTCRFTAGALLAAGLAATAAPAAAYRMIQNTSVRRVSSGSAVPCSAAGGFAHWEVREIPWYLNSAGKGRGKWLAVTAALAAWNAVAAADHLLTFAGTTSAGFAADGRNTILWAEGNGCTGGCLAMTALVLEAGQVIVETDISFNSSHAWKTNGKGLDTEAVAAHELGHTLGIHHTNLAAVPRPTMAASYFGAGARTLEPDDQAALQCSEGRY